MTEIAVVYYSRTANTRQVARDLARRLSADVVAIKDPKPRTGALGYLRSAYEAWRHQQAPIVPHHFEPERYRAVVIATPVWAHNPPSPVRAWLAQYASQLPKVAFVCTYGGAGAEQVLHQLATLTAKHPLAELALRTSDIDYRSYHYRLEALARPVELALEAGTHVRAAHENLHLIIVRYEPQRHGA